MGKENMAGQRTRIGLLFNASAGWLGGVYYLLNLVRTLAFLPRERRPEIVVFYNPRLKAQVEELEYPHLITREWDFTPESRGYLSSILMRKNLFIDGFLRGHELDFLYPVFDFPVKSNCTVKCTQPVAWYADLQHKHYPGNFSMKQRLLRRARLGFMMRNATDLVVSSHDVAADFNRFFRPGPNITIHVYQFVSVIDDLSGLDSKAIAKKYGLPETYYMISNQFHIHKNHQVLLECLSHLKSKGVNRHFAVTGKLPDDERSKHIRGLRSYIDKNDLKDLISFLGVIPRKEQLVLMKHSEAIIQPSFFEGWSTVIEDAKSLQVPVIASHLPVNLEQLGDSGTFFDPNDPIELARIIRSFPERDLRVKPYRDYHTRVREAAESFMDILEKCRVSPG